MNLRGSRGGVIPGEQRETRNPGGIAIGKDFIFLDASFRWHDETRPIRINEMDQYLCTLLLHPIVVFAFPRSSLVNSFLTHR